MHACWHITWGTYGTRLHGGDRPTVDRPRTKLGDPFLGPDGRRFTFERNRMRNEPVRLTPAQRRFAQDRLPAICERGGWIFLLAAAGEDHVHVLLDIDPTVRATRVRGLWKRWTTHALDERWARPSSGTWWARGGSTKPVRHDAHRRNVIRYLEHQRA